jgi:hypothetical protein
MVAKECRDHKKKDHKEDVWLCVLCDPSRLSGMND